jgi:hypothetical protein
MKTKQILTGLLVAALGIATLGLTGCGKSESGRDGDGHMHEHGANAAVPGTNPVTPAPKADATNSPAAAPDTNATPPAAEIKPAPAKQYTCVMHPEVVQDAPGKCPKCGMKLVEKK